jgi:hypothetical protein
VGENLLGDDLKALQVIQVEALDHDLLDAGRGIRANLLDDLGRRAGDGVGRALAQGGQRGRGRDARLLCGQVPQPWSEFGLVGSR